MTESTKNSSAKLSKVKSSLWSRSFALAKITLSSGSQMAAQSILSLLEEKSKKDERWLEFFKDQAHVLSRELGQLKGSAMKAGQLLSMYGEHFFPKEANDILKSLQSQSPPLEWAAVQKILVAELGPEKLATLEIENESIGSASLGQVHRARIRKSGEMLALKIQYPGVDKAIDSDLRALKSILSLFQILPQGKGVDMLFDEVRSMLHQEIDYRKEAELTDKYRQKLGDDPRFVIPKVFPEYCADKVLATSFEHGLSPDDPEVLSLPLERRNKIALNYLDLYFHEVFKWGLVQTDPHLGNYRIRIPDDKIVLLDFGAVREYPKSFLEPYYKMVSSSLFYDHKNLIESAQELGFVTEGDSPDLLRIFQEFCFMTVEPFISPEDSRNTSERVQSDGSYDWKNSDLPRRLTKKVFEMIQTFHIRPPPREVLFLDRKTGGVFIFLSVLQANINARPLLLKYLKPID